MYFLIYLPILIIVVAVKLLALAPLLWKWNFPLRQVPGPRVAGWTRLWWITVFYTGNGSSKLVEISKKKW